MIFRSEKNKNYTVMSNYHLRDKNLSLKAKGLMSLLLSLPDDWNFSISGLLSLIKESETCLHNTLAELKREKYLVVTKYNDENGRFDYIYDLFETPQNDSSPASQSPDLQNLSMESGGLLNTNIINTEKINTESNKEKNTKKESLKKLTASQALPLIQEEFDLSEEVVETLKEFFEVRKLKKSPLTGYSLRLLVLDLIKLSDDPETQVAIINQSIVNSWKGFFALKTNKPQPIGSDQGRYKQPELEAEDVIEKLRRKYEEEERKKSECQT